MEKTLLELGVANGIWAALFVFLFLYVLFDSRRREGKYQETIRENQNVITQLCEKVGIIDNIQKDVSEIKIELKRR